MKLQLIEKMTSLGPCFKITDGDKCEIVSYSNEANSGRTRDEALKCANEIFSFWLKYGSQENILREMEYKEV